jgi:hypothetical protein
VFSYSLKIHIVGFRAIFNHLCPLSKTRGREHQGEYEDEPLIRGGKEYPFSTSFHSDKVALTDEMALTQLPKKIHLEMVITPTKILKTTFCTLCIFLDKGI